MKSYSFHWNSHQITNQLWLKCLQINKKKISFVHLLFTNNILPQCIHIVFWNFLHNILIAINFHLLLCEKATNYHIPFNIQKFKTIKFITTMNSLVILQNKMVFIVIDYAAVNWIAHCWQRHSNVNLTHFNQQSR